MILKSEGYKMFRGMATIVPKNGREPYKVVGDWLYKPEYGCWYVNGSSYPDEIVENICPERDFEEIVRELKVRLNAMQELVVSGGNVKEIDKILTETRVWVSEVESV